MSYNYSKLERNKVYPDPTGTISKYRVICTNVEEYNFKNNGYLILYLMRDRFIIRSLYDPDVFSVRAYGRVFLEIPFSSITRISCCGEEFFQIIDLADYALSNAQRSNILVEYLSEKKETKELHIRINCYISLSKNSRECQELINLFNKTFIDTVDSTLNPQARPLLTDKLYLRSPTLNINGRFTFKAYRDKFVFKPQSDNQEEICIPLDDIVSLTHEREFQGTGTALSQDSYLKLVYKDVYNKQITVFIQFYLLNLNNAYPQKYIDFLTALQDLGLLGVG